MFLVKEIMMFTKKKLKIIIDENNAIILGTGTGVSSAAGFEYDGKNLYKRRSSHENGACGFLLK